MEGLVASWRRLLQRRWPWGLAAGAAVAAVVAAALFLPPPTWRADARLRLSEPPPAPGVSPTGGVLSLLRPGGDPFANELELLGSRTVAEEVTRSLALSAEVEAPGKWYRDSLFVSMRSTAATEEATFRIVWEGDGVRVDRLEPVSASAVARGAPGKPLRFGGLVVVPRARRPDGPTAVRLKTLPFAEAAERFRRALDFERSRRDANVLDLTYDHTDPGVAVAAVQTAVTRYVETRGKLYGRESGTTVDSLREVADSTAAELARAEAALAALQRESGLVAPEVQAEAYVERWVEARTAVEETRAELSLVESALRRSESAASRAEAWTTLVAQPRFLENPTVGDLVTRLSALEEERLALASRRSPESRELGVVQDQIRTLDASLRSVATSYARSLRESLEEQTGREAALRATLDGLPGDALEVGRRQRDVRLLTEVLVGTEQRLRQEEIRKALSFANVQVIDPPALEYEPVWPRPKLGAAVGLLLAFGTGVLAMVVVERADGRIRRVADVRELVAGPVLATPTVRDGRMTLGAGEAEALRRAAEPGARLVLGAPEDPGDARMLAELLQEAREGPVEARAAGPVTTYGDAVEVVGDGGAPVILVVRSGGTGRRALRRAAALVRDAGGGIGGSVLVGHSRRGREALWT